MSQPDFPFASIAIPPEVRPRDWQAYAAESLARLPPMRIKGAVEVTRFKVVPRASVTLVPTRADVMRTCGLDRTALDTVSNETGHRHDLTRLTVHTPRLKKVGRGRLLIHERGVGGPGPGWRNP